MEDLQNVMDPPTAEEALGSRAESRCGWEGRGKMRVRARLQRAVHALRLRRTPAGRAQKESSGTQSRDGKGRGGSRGRRLEDKQQDACLAALLGHLHVQLDTKGIVSLFVSLTQYKQITHGPMEPAKHRVQCIQNHVSYKEHIHQIIYTACSTKQLSMNAKLGVQYAADLGEQAAGLDGTCFDSDQYQLKGEHRFNSYVPQRSVFMNGNNCAPKLETRDPRMCRVLSQ